MKCSDVNPNEETSSTLLHQARQRDEAAWRRLVNTYSRPIYRWCRQAGLQPADASNVVQEVLRSVARKLPDYRHERPSDTFRGWLRRIAQNKIRDHWRLSVRQETARGGTDAHEWIMQKAAPPSSSVLAGAAEPQGAMAEAIAQVRNECSNRDWLFFWRVVVDGQSAVEVGEEFGVTANAVRLVKMRVLRKLRQVLPLPGEPSEGG